MSDDYLRLVPTDPTWRPEPPAATAATAYVAGLFAVPGAAADEVTHEFFPAVALIDSGVNTSAASCPVCEAPIDLAWVFDVVDERAADLSHLDVVLPACGDATSLNDLAYDWPMGFASFEVCVLNGTRAEYDLQPSELDDVAALLGHPVRQVLAHY